MERKTIVEMKRIFNDRYWLKLECGHIVERKHKNFELTDNETYMKYNKATCDICKQLQANRFDLRVKP